MGTKTWATLLFGATISVFAARDAHAAQACSFVSVVGVSFGGYDTLSSIPLDGTGRIVFVCTGLAPNEAITIIISRGEGKSFIPREMKSHRDRMEYNVYLDAARTIVWGDGTGNSGAYVARPADGVPTTVDLFGRIPPRQNVTAGSYRDHLLVTMLF